MAKITVHGGVSDATVPVPAPAPEPAPVEPIQVEDILAGAVKVAAPSRRRSTR